MSDVCVTVFDIGAANGVDGGWAKIGGVVDVHGFEPEPAAFRKLLAEPPAFVRRCTFHSLAIGPHNGEAVLHVTARPTCSSLREPNTPCFELFDQPGSPRNMRARVVALQTVSTVTLDAFSTKVGVQADVVKLDTQGTEFEIIDQGGRNTLTMALAAEIEVEFVELYRGQKLFAEVELLMRSLGFQLVGLKRHHWKRHDGRTVSSGSGGSLVFGDALFVNRRVLDEVLSPDESTRAVLILLRYGLGDIAARLARSMGIDPESLSRLLASIDRSELLPDSSKPFVSQDRGKIVDFDDLYGMSG